MNYHITLTGTQIAIAVWLCAAGYFLLKRKTIEALVALLVSFLLLYLNWR